MSNFLVLFEFNNAKRAKEKVKDVYNIFNKIKAAKEWEEDRSRDKKSTYMHQLKEHHPVVYKILSNEYYDEDQVEVMEISFEEDEWDINHQCVTFPIQYHSHGYFYDDMAAIGEMLCANYTETLAMDWCYWDFDYDFWYYHLLDSWKANTSQRRIHELEKRIEDLKKENVSLRKELQK